MRMRPLTFVAVVAAIACLAQPAGAHPGTGAPERLVWQSRSPMLTARAGLGVAVLPNGKICAMGGLLRWSEWDINEEYDLVTDTWTTRARMPTARGGLGAATVNGRIYAVGGGTLTATLSTVEEYDPATDTWRARHPYPDAIAWGLGFIALIALPALSLARVREGGHSHYSRRMSGK
jgi:hypothetical protein